MMYSGIAWLGLPRTHGFYLWVQIKQLCHQREGFFWLPEFCQVSCCPWGSDICSHAQLLTWTLTAFLPELQPHSLFKLPLEQGVPVRLSMSMWAERSVASFSSLLTTSGKISQHLVNRPNQGSGWGGVLGGNSAANTQQCALFCCSETITTRGCHWEQWQLHSKSS